MIKSGLSTRAQIVSVVAGVIQVITTVGRVLVGLTVGQVIVGRVFVGKSVGQVIRVGRVSVLVGLTVGQLIVEYGGGSVITVGVVYEDGLVSLGIGGFVVIIHVSLG